MPKIFGDVKLGENGKAICMKCHNSWIPSNEQLEAFRNNRLVTCPVCRVTKEHRPGMDIVPGFFNIHYTEFQKISPALYRDDNYQDCDIPIFHKIKNCRKIFTVKSRYLEAWVKNPVCPICNPSGFEKIQQDKLDGVSKQQEDIGDKNKEKGDSGVDRLRELKLKKLIDKVESGSRIIGIDIPNMEVDTYCVYCGTERHLPLRNLNKEILKCPVCSTEGRQSLPQLYTKYVGKVYNGMIITSVSTINDSTVCELHCIDNFGHVLKDVELGKVINNLVYCQACTNSGRMAISKYPKLSENFAMACKDFEDNLKYLESMNNSKGMGYNVSRYSRPGVFETKVTVAQFYSGARRQNAYLCDYCKHKNDCLKRRDPLNASKFNLDKLNFKYVSALMDELDSIKSIKMDVCANYDAIYSPGKYPGAGVCDIDVQKKLIMFRDAYRGRDGQVYRFCKCLEHNIEMILSEKELAEFSHEQCSSERSPFQRFYDIDNDYLLKKKLKTEDKKKTSKEVKS